MDCGSEKAVPERPVFDTLEPRLLLSDTMFGPPQGISMSADGAVCAYATDLDGDGDADVLSASIGDDKIAWYENFGGGVFGERGRDPRLACLCSDNDLGGAARGPHRCPERGRR